MVKILTGKINSMKTQRMLDLYKRDHRGDGFISIKHMIKDKVHSYEAMRLSTGERLPFIIRDEFVYQEFPISCQIGPYLFNQATIDKVTEAISIMVNDKISPIYLDEIGLLELEGKCFDHILRKMVASKLDLVLSMRVSLVEAIINKYQIDEYEIIHKEGETDDR
ncbi:MAG: nucleoside-triphosphatase [Candidatus Izemoplasmatales bacterium]